VGTATLLFLEVPGPVLRLRPAAALWSTARPAEKSKEKIQKKDTAQRDPSSLSRRADDLRNP